MAITAIRYIWSEILIVEGGGVSQVHRLRATSGIPFWGGNLEKSRRFLLHFNQVPYGQPIPFVAVSNAMLFGELKRRR